MSRLASWKSVFAIAALLMLSISIGYAQAASPAVLKYDKAAEAKLKGVVDDVSVDAADHNTVHLALKTDKGLATVHVGPDKFLKELEVSFTKGEQVEVTGSVFTVDGKVEVLAREITRTDGTVLLRDDKGKPVWVGWIK